MPTLIEHNSIDKDINLAKELSLDFIEINMNLPWHCPAKLSSSKLLDYTDSTGIFFTMHLPEELDFATNHTPIRKGYLKTCIDMLNWASKANIKKATMHLNPGIYFSLPNEKVFVYEVEYEESFIRFDNSFATLYKKAEELGITICIENTGSFVMPHTNKWLIYLLDNYNIGLTYDLGHDGTQGHNQLFVFKDYWDRVKHLHIHDYTNMSNHLPIGTGDADMNFIIELMSDINRQAVLEVKTKQALIESVKYIRNLLC